MWAVRASAAPDPLRSARRDTCVSIGVTRDSRRPRGSTMGLALGDRELCMHPGCVVAREVTDELILPGRQGEGQPT